MTGVQTCALPISVIVDSSWKMVFAKDEAEFNSLLKEMQDTVKGLGYKDVLKVDMKNAQDEANARIQVVKDYNEKHPNSDKDE